MCTSNGTSAELRYLSSLSFHDFCTAIKCQVEVPLHTMTIYMKNVHVKASWLLCQNVCRHESFKEIVSSETFNFFKVLKGLELATQGSVQVQHSCLLGTNFCQ